MLYAMPHISVPFRTIPKYSGYPDPIFHDAKSKNFTIQYLFKGRKHNLFSRKTTFGTL